MRKNSRLVDEYSKNVEEQRSASRLQIEGVHYIFVRRHSLSVEIRPRLLRPTRVAGEQIVGNQWRSQKYYEEETY